MSEPLICGCCERPEDRCELRSVLPGLQKLWNMPPLMCRDCLAAWYDGGLTDPEAIKARVLEQAGEVG